MEFSAVAVPANQDAIAEAVKSFGKDFAKDFFTEEKSGRKISAQTREILNKIKACGDELEKCQSTIKGLRGRIKKSTCQNLMMKKKIPMKKNSLSNFPIQ